ncbi:MAG: L-glutamate gamma-semialdehyde dehydrogenase [Holophagales bacterium]|nr:L-glutamate gamma-semialdehyde dehydrogenase [Holophagales bacterium]
MSNGMFRIPKPKNEPVLSYAPGSRERASLKLELARQSENKVIIPLIIGGQEIYTEQRTKVVMPHKHSHVLAECCSAGEKELILAIEAAMAAKESWEAMPWEHQSAIFLRAAELFAGKYRALISAATMLCQSKTAYQAEIDAPCELVDFLRFNAYWADQIYRQQPENSLGVWNRMLYRPLDGFVLAITPFNFTAIGANLCTAPAMLGNTTLWKPSATSVLSSYYVMKVLMEAGLPAGVINFVPASGSAISKHVISDPRMSGLHFTGSTGVFGSIWRQVGENIRSYHTYPRLVGETGGKDFIFAHSSAEIPALASAIVRGAFEYQGQKCSALSRTFVPKSIWPDLKKILLEETGKLKTGDVRDFRNFMGAVIDQASFDKLKEYINEARASNDADVLCGGYDDSEGYFVYPTIIHARVKSYKTMVEELFGPVLTIFVYPDEELDDILRFCDESTPYALTGAIFAQDRQAIVKMEQMLNKAAGNFYINDKPTGAVVGQQPFGGSRASGTNDKAGSAINLYRWMSIRTIKENFNPAKEIVYPFMDEE